MILATVGRALWILVVVEIIVVGLFSKPFAVRLWPPRPPRCDFEQVDTIAAQQLREQLEQFSEDSAENWRDLAKPYMAFGYYAEATVCLQHCAEIEPLSFETKYLQGTCFGLLGRTEEAILAFYTAVELADEKDIADCWYQIGFNHLKRENEDEAVTAFKKAGKHSLAQFQLAKLSFRSGRVPEAATLLDYVLRENPDTVRPKLLRAQIEADLGNTTAAAEFREQAERSKIIFDLDLSVSLLLDIRASYGARQLYHEARRLEKEGKLPEAAIVLREATAADKELAEKYIPQLAAIQTRLGRTAESIELLETLMRRTGPSPGSLAKLADAYYLNGQPERAFHIAQRSLGMRSTKSVHQALASYHAKQGDLVLARQHHALVQQAIGVSAYRVNQLEAARVALEQATEWMPRLAQSWYYLGQSYGALGDRKRAQVAFERCLTIDPDHGRARTGRKLTELSQ